MPHGKKVVSLHEGFRLSVKESLLAVLPCVQLAFLEVTPGQDGRGILVHQEAALLIHDADFRVGRQADGPYHI